MKFLPALLVAWLFLPGFGFSDVLKGGKPYYIMYSHFDKELQKTFLQFKLLTSTNSPGDSKFRQLKLENPVNFGGKNYYGFRVAVPRRTNQEDLVVALIIPKGSPEMGIIPQNWDTVLQALDQINGVTNFDYFRFKGNLYFPRTDYPELRGLLPSSGTFLQLQYLSGDALQDGQEYLIWFGFNSNMKPNWLSVKFTFANLTGLKKPETNARNRNVFEQALGLHRRQPKADPSTD